jgi:hypothetical protein
LLSPFSDFVSVSFSVSAVAFAAAVFLFRLFRASAFSDCLFGIYPYPCSGFPFLFACFGALSRLQRRAKP